MMFSLCAIIAPAVTIGDQSVNRLEPTNVDDYCSMVATVSTHTDPLTYTKVSSHTDDTLITHRHKVKQICKELNGK